MVVKVDWASRQSPAVVSGNAPPAEEVQKMTPAAGTFDARRRIVVESTDGYQVFDQEEFVSHSGRRVSAERGRLLAGALAAPSSSSCSSSGEWTGPPSGVRSPTHGSCPWAPSSWSSFLIYAARVVALGLAARAARHASGTSTSSRRRWSGSPRGCSSRAPASCCGRGSCPARYPIALLGRARHDHPRAARRHDHGAASSSRSTFSSFRPRPRRRRARCCSSSGGFGRPPWASSRREASSRSSRSRWRSWSSPPCTRTPAG